MDSDYYDKELHVDLRDFHEVKKISDDIDNLRNKIKPTANCDDFLIAVGEFYDSAYRRGYDAGVKEGQPVEESFEDKEVKEWMQDAPEKLTRTNIATANEIRQAMGLKPINDPEAEKLIKKEEQ